MKFPQFQSFNFTGSGSQGRGTIASAQESGGYEHRRFIAVGGSVRYSGFPSLIRNYETPMRTRNTGIENRISGVGEPEGQSLVTLPGQSGESLRNFGAEY